MSEKKPIKGIPVGALDIALATFAIILSLILMISSSHSVSGYKKVMIAAEDALRAQSDAELLRKASDYLTRQTRDYVATGDLQAIALYFQESEETRRWETAVEDIRKLTGNDETFSHIEYALQRSKALQELEFQAMRLEAAAHGVDPESLPEKVRQVELDAETLALDAEQLHHKAMELVFSAAYQELKDQVLDSVAECTESLIATTTEKHEVAGVELARHLQREQYLITTLICTMGIMLLLNMFLVIRPLQKATKELRGGNMLAERGGKEMRMLAGAYNELQDTINQTQQKLAYDANHDQLTGLLNRKAYEQALLEQHGRAKAMILVDVDYFKDINDTYGHEVGDRTLQRVAKALRESFRTEDFVCRIGGDEFCIIMVHMVRELLPVIERKLNHVREALKDPIDNVPALTLSIGIAFEGDENGELFRAADLALYHVKERGRNGYMAYLPSMHKE